MNKTILLTIASFLICGITSVDAQNFKSSGKTASELYSNTILNTAEGDLNKDGVKDLIISAENATAIYWGNTSGYNLFKDYDLRIHQNAKISINDKGVLRIQIDSDNKTDVFLYRYQNNALVLIGGKKDRHKSEHYDYSYNFSTGKMIKTTGEGANKQSVTETMPKQPALKFGWIPLKWDMLDYLFELDENDLGLPTESMLAMGIFRRMQNDDMMHWALCDYESEYGRSLQPGEKANSWEAYGSYEAPGSYNMYTDITILKLNSNTYSIVVNETSQDRSYEAELNEEGSNLDELDVPEDDTSTTKYTFNDGKFIEQ